MYTNTDFVSTGHYWITVVIDVAVHSRKPTYSGNFIYSFFLQNNFFFLYKIKFIHKKIYELYPEGCLFDKRETTTAATLCSHVFSA